MIKNLIILLVFVTVASAYETVYAVNYGKDEVNHTDSLGVFYTHTTKDCTASWKYGGVVKNIPTGDRPLYQGYCHSFDNDATKIPLTGSGRYFLVIKFRSNNIDINSDILLSKEHYILRNFDLLTDKNVTNAFDVTAVFTACGNRLIFNNEISTIVDSTVELKFNFNKGDDILLAAIGLFKEDEERALPNSMATNVFKGNDWNQQILYACYDNQIVDKTKLVAPSVTNNYYNFVFNIENNNLNKDSLVEDEF